MIFIIFYAQCKVADQHWTFPLLFLNFLLFFLLSRDGDGLNTINEGMEEEEEEEEIEEDERDQSQHSVDLSHSQHSNNREECIEKNVCFFC